MRSVAIVTGAGRGIGRAIADELSKADYAVARVSIEPQEQGAIPTADRYYQSDVADIAQHGALLARIASDLGEPCCLVNNAGVTSLQRGDLLDLSPESYDRTLGINLRAAFFLSQAFARRRLSTADRSPGSIIFIGSANAEIVGENRADYCISKAGVAMMTKLFASRLAAHEIAVYEIRPGVIRTDMTAAAKDRYDALIVAGGIPMARWGEPEEIGRTVAVLATGQIPYATGIHIDVGGGFQLYRV
ncbi:3-ketoacyl-ACP reductase [Bradyrhizobium japonicum]|uniref:3-ketoacyl-ACP reductase n=1 Tax=Bradyrhizobium japonicum TaxID=375 RepID=UPI0004B5163D|nr:3-ketoacyl-ACP reductase [Bradyrhizobium japonicum]MBR0735011.1 3-ketoacyl-ACP reductase [Bradyrhizobium japonicum]MBR0746953.1 3-ketoacyl-ACP reductase [Bradyrhizobium japonicum]MBR0809486.1 3-ketoacyl-ACP reductase [Bradyrhizobium japonicum]MCS3496265.1 NAD(P)-dependent dehydrogenase (short-subunit alcohol dehydrogenase family) [Bradyrhizobium japonicum]MCS3961572.1 NAD(P)-dependent dehydrogenase (short-subunit alcohol dehydrogenase family) [Bradyrhizobium japonicum]